jgi:hypothetical protein
MPWTHRPIARRGFLTALIAAYHGESVILAEKADLYHGPAGQTEADPSPCHGAIGGQTIRLTKHTRCPPERPLFLSDLRLIRAHQSRTQGIILAALSAFA